MLLGILKESAPGETRVALLPGNLKSLIAQGTSVVVEAGAGEGAGASDQAYIEAGATVSADRASVLTQADVLPVVNAPAAEDQAQLKPGRGRDRFSSSSRCASARCLPAIERPATLFSMELVPRITRAQSMDALSSMATVAGYKAVIAAADRLPRLFPMLMTAAGTVPPGQGVRHRRGRRGTAGHRHRPSPGRGGGGLRRARRGGRTGSFAGRQVSRRRSGRHQHRGRRRLCRRADRRGARSRPRPHHQNCRAL